MTRWQAGETGVQRTDDVAVARLRVEAVATGVAALDVAHRSGRTETGVAQLLRRLHLAIALGAALGVVFVDPVGPVSARRRHRRRTSRSWLLGRQRQIALVLVFDGGQLVDVGDLTAGASRRLHHRRRRGRGPGQIAPVLVFDSGQLVDVGDLTAAASRRLGRRRPRPTTLVVVVVVVVVRLGGGGLRPFGDDRHVAMDSLVDGGPLLERGPQRGVHQRRSGRRRLGRQIATVLILDGGQLVDVGELVAGDPRSLSRRAVLASVGVSVVARVRVAQVFVIQALAHLAVRLLHHGARSDHTALSRSAGAVADGHARFLVAPIKTSAAGLLRTGAARHAAVRRRTVSPLADHRLEVETQLQTSHRLLPSRYFIDIGDD